MELDYKEIAKKINKAAKDAGNTAHHSEAKLRELVTPLWQEYLKTQQIDFNFVTRDELILANGTPDTVFNRLIFLLLNKYLCQKYEIGGYQVLEKWSRSHRDRIEKTISYQEQETFIQIYNILAFTIEQMKEIDGIVKKMMGK